MPPPVVKTVRDLIFWQYAKIIAESAGFGKRNYGFVMKKFQELKKGEIFWNEIRKYVKEREKKDECIFCGAKTNLTIDHMLPRCFNGPDDEKNIIWVCKTCNASKGRKDFTNFGRLKRDWKALSMTCPE
ncbi:MAG: HNH endonuclease [Candidatus Bathycorpusculaceae bacterium]